MYPETCLCVYLRRSSNILAVHNLIPKEIMKNDACSQGLLRAWRLKI